MRNSEPRPSTTLDVMVRRTTFLPCPKDEKGNSRTTSHYPTWEAALHRSRHALETQLSKSHPELIFIPTILCIKIPLQALPTCKTHYTYYHYPIEDLCLRALQPSPLFIAWLHILFRECLVVDWMIGHNYLPRPIYMPFVMWLCYSSY